MEAARPPIPPADYDDGEGSGGFGLHDSGKVLDKPLRLVSKKAERQQKTNG